MAAMNNWIPFCNGLKKYSREKVSQWSSGCNLSPEVKASYPLTKEALLASVGLSFHHYVDELFTPNKANDTTPEMALHHSSTVAKFIFKDANTLDDAIWTITKLHTLRQYTPECVQTVLKQDPCKPHELSTAIRRFE